MGHQVIESQGMEFTHWNSQSGQPFPEGEIEIKIRATDIFLSSTPPEDQGHVFSVYTSECCSDDSSWISKNLSSIVLVSTFSLLLLGMVAVILQIRKSDFD